MRNGDGGGDEYTRYVWLGKCTLNASRGSVFGSNEADKATVGALRGGRSDGWFRQGRRNAHGE